MNPPNLAIFIVISKISAIFKALCLFFRSRSPNNIYYTYGGSWGRWLDDFFVVERVQKLRIRWWVVSATQATAMCNSDFSAKKFEAETNLVRNFEKRFERKMTRCGKITLMEKRAN